MDIFSNFQLLMNVGIEPIINVAGSNCFDHIILHEMNEASFGWDCLVDRAAEKNLGKKHDHENHNHHCQHVSLE